jgi:LemA protein
MDPMWLIAAAALGVVFWTIYAYNRLVRGKNLVREAWSGIDVQLKRRHNLVPDLVEAVKGYARHEKAVLEKVTETRGRAAQASGIVEMQEGENALSDQIKGLLAVVEAYPDLKAARSFLDLQERLCEIEDRIQMARRYYNGATRDFNIRVESFPGNIVAKAFRFAPADFFQIATATEREAPEVDL